MLRRTPLTRKTPLSRGSKPIARKKRMNRVSKQRAVKRAKAAELFCDSKGIPFHEANSWFPGRVPVKKPDVDDFSVCRAYHSGDCGNVGECWMCNRWEVITEAHHIVPRSDETANIVMVCRACHTEVQDNPKALPRVLKAKWLHDRIHTDWRRIIELRGKKFTFDSLE